jgi:hypothetical protein
MLCLGFGKGCLGIGLQASQPAIFGHFDPTMEDSVIITSSFHDLFTPPSLCFKPPLHLFS